MPLALKAQVTVRGGVLPGNPEAEYSRAWQYTSEDYESDVAVPADQPTRFSKMLDEAHEYAKGLSNPSRVNWVEVNWLWI